MSDFTSTLEDSTEYWPHIRTIHVRDECRELYPINYLDQLIFALPAMLSTTRLVFHLTISPSNDLLAAVATMPSLRSLEFEGTRLDGSLPALKMITMLEKLTMTIIPQIKDTPHPRDIDTHVEQFNITTFFQTVSSHLSYLEIAGDLLSLSTLAPIHWPNLRTLIISGHQPSEPHLPLASIISGMPKLVDVRLTFSAAYGSRFPPFLICPGSESTRTVPHLASAAPQLHSLSLSNVSPEDDVFNQLPSSLTRLRILALTDPISPMDDPFYPWYPYSPLSLSRSFDLVEKLVHLVSLVELSLTIVGTPTPELVRAIAGACPGLRLLELEEEQYANVAVQFPSDLVNDIIECYLPFPYLIFSYSNNTSTR